MLLFFGFGGFGGGLRTGQEVVSAELVAGIVCWFCLVDLVDLVVVSELIRGWSLHTFSIAWFVVSEITEITGDNWRTGDTFLDI